MNLCPCGLPIPYGKKYCNAAHKRKYFRPAPPARKFGYPRGEEKLGPGVMAFLYSRINTAENSGYRWGKE